MLIPAHAHARALEALPLDAPRRYDRVRIELPDGATSTLHAVRLDRREFRMRVVEVGELGTLARWCRATESADAIVGGFFVRPQRAPLGELRIDGRAIPTEPFDRPWDGVRSCVHVWGGRIRIARRFEIAAEPPGDLLQAGPLLVRDRATVVAGDSDPEGFSSGERQFDSDITRGRYPRAALALTRTHLIAAACEGRAASEAGMTLNELADALIGLGAQEAINLDGGGSASLVHGGRLRNSPREEHGIEIVGGRPIATALVFEPQAA